MSDNKWITYNGNTIRYGSKLLTRMPPMTLRLLFYDGATPTFSKGTATQISQSPNVWDLMYNNPDWFELLAYQTNLKEVLDAGDTSSVTNMGSMFRGCTNLGSVTFFDTSNVNSMERMFYECSRLTGAPLFDTSSVTNMSRMFTDTSLKSVPLFNTSSVTTMSFMLAGCHGLTSVPLFNTSSVTNMDYMLSEGWKLTSIPLFDTSRVQFMNHTFSKCLKVESGALALYQQVSSQAVHPLEHRYAFQDCGRDTVTGAAELAQIPSGWK